jgi:hypothetical protein
LNIEINVEDVCLDLLIVRKHVYNQYNCNRSFKAAYHTHVGVRMYIVQCAVYTGEDKKERKETTGRRMPSFVAAST